MSDIMAYMFNKHSTVVSMSILRSPSTCCNCIFFWLNTKDDNVFIININTN